jgi:Fur family ferric uptake transcriptional regulator
VSNQELRNAGLRVTLPRLKVLQILENADGAHLSAENVFKALQESGDDVGLATVYRVLTQFESAGLVKRHNFEGGYSVFELDEGEHHDHMVCVCCGRVEEFFDDTIEKRQQEIVDRAGFQMTEHILTIYGFCKECKNQASNLET